MPGRRPGRGRSAGRGFSNPGRGTNASGGRTNVKGKFGEDDIFCKPSDIVETLLVLPADDRASEGVEKALSSLPVLTSKTWTEVISLLGKTRRHDLAICVLAWLRTASSGIDVNEYHCSATISACEKSGNWRAALDVLDHMLDSTGHVKPNVFCYSGAINACEKGGEIVRAIEIFEGMEKRGVVPNHFCYSAAIRACARAKRWQKALQYLEEMCARGISPNNHTYTAAITACHHGGQWLRALSLLKEARSSGIEPDVVAYGAAVSACCAGGQWQAALDLLKDMSSYGVPPNSVTYNAALGACEKGARWMEALDLLSTMRSQRVSPDIVSYNAALGACEAAGRSSEATSIYETVAATLPHEDSPYQILHGLAVLAKSEHFASGDASFAPSLSKAALAESSESVRQILPDLQSRDLGLFMWSLARLGLDCSSDLVKCLQEQVLRLEKELNWQVVGQIDYSLRCLELGATASKRAKKQRRDPLGSEVLTEGVQACLKRAGALAAAEVARSSLKANAAPAELLLSLEGESGPCGRGDELLLVVDDIDAFTSLEARGCKVEWWGRMSVRDRLGAVSPPRSGSPYRGGAVVRLSGVQSNSGGASLRLAVAAVAARLPHGAPIWLCGLEEEGISEASPVLRGLFSGVVEAARDGGARVLYGKRCCDTDAKPIDEFRGIVQLTLSEVGQADVEGWHVWPGLFAGGGLDVMTSFLLRRLPKVTISPSASILDFCCGSGTIACAVLNRQPKADVHLTDADALAIDAARRNMAAAAGRCYLGDGWRAVPAHLQFDWIISNPPVHRRRQDDFSVVEELISGAASHLRQPGGRLWIVAQVHIPVGAMLENYGFRAKIESDGRFGLWRARPA